MSEPISNSSQDDPGSEGGDRRDGVDPAVDRFHERNRKRKRKLISRLVQGAAFETGKELAKEQDFGQRLLDFLEWLQG